MLTLVTTIVDYTLIDGMDWAGYIMPVLMDSAITLKILSEV